MKAVFGGVSLLIVMAVVLWMASRGAKTAAQPAVPAVVNSPAAASTQVQQVRDDVNRALEQGAAQRAEVEK